MRRHKALVSNYFAGRIYHHSDFVGPFIQMKNAAIIAIRKITASPVSNTAIMLTFQVFVLLYSRQL